MNQPQPKEPMQEQTPVNKPTGVIAIKSKRGVKYYDSEGKRVK